MAEQAAQPDPVHVELPRVNADDVFLIISKCLLDIPIEHWYILKYPFCKLTRDTLTALAASCMDVVQKLAEGILDLVVPQVYSYARTHGAVSPGSFRVTEDQVQAYVGDSVEQALASGLKTPVQILSHTKQFSQLLHKHVSRTVNSVLALFSPTLESRLPVVLVSGCVASVAELKHLAEEMATMLMFILNPQHQFSEDRFKSSLCKWSEELYYLSYYLNPRDDFRKKVKAHLIHMLQVLRESLGKPCPISAGNQRVVCVRVGSNTKLVTVEDGEAHTSEPETDKGESPSRFRPVDRMRDVVLIRDIVDELMKVFMDNLPTEEETGRGETAGLQLDAAQHDAIRTVTNRIFDLVADGQGLQSPLLRSARPGGVRGAVAHAAYVRTGEVVTRCAVLMLLWARLNVQRSYFLVCPSPAFVATIDVDAQPPELPQSRKRRATTPAVW